MSSQQKIYVKPIYIEPEESDESDVSKLVRLFQKKNKRVRKIFRDDDDDDDDDGEQISYGLRLRTRSLLDDVNNESDQEQENEPQLIRSQSVVMSGSGAKMDQNSSHVKNLSPVEVITLSSEDVDEELPDPAETSNKKKNAASSMLPPSIVKVNKALRRSLFGFNPPVQSTPKTVSKRSEVTLQPQISPIKYSPLSSQEDDLNGVVPIEKINVLPLQPKEHIREVHSVAQLEDDLQKQYAISEHPSPPKRSQKRMERRSISLPPTPYRRGMPIASDQASAADMEIDEPEKSSTQISARKSFNQTNMNSVKMIETMIQRGKALTPAVPKELQMLLQRCDDTSDDSVHSEADNLPETSNKAVSVVSKINKKCEAQTSKSKEHVKGKPKAKSSASSEAETSDDENSMEMDKENENRENDIEPEVSTVNDVAANPTPEESASESNASILKVIPVEVVHSFRALPKSKSTEKVSEQSKKSLNIKKPQMMKKGILINPSTQSYLDLKKKRSSSRLTNAQQTNDSTMGRKRALYSMNSPDVRQIRKEPPPSQRNKIGSSQIPVEEASSSREQENEGSQPSENSIRNLRKRSSQVLQDTESENEESPPPVFRKPNAKRRKSTERVPEAENAAGPSKRVLPKRMTRNNSSVNFSVQASPPKAPSEHSDEPEMRSSDEGFFDTSGRSQEDNTNDFLYRPSEQGCKREGLRDRRLAKPYWLKNPLAADVRVSATALTIKKYQKEQKSKQELQKLLKKHHLSEKYRTDEARFLEGAFFSSDGKLKLLRENQGLIFKVPAKPAAKARSKTNSVKSKSSHPKTEYTQTTSTSSDSVSNNSATSTVINMLQSLRNGTNTSQTSTPSVSSETYDLASVENVEFIDCQNGVYFGRFVENRSDGLIKLIPGGSKPLAKSKTSYLKFLCLYGKAQFTVAGEKAEVNAFGYISINPGSHYQIENISNEEVILSFTRLDRPFKR